MERLLHFFTPEKYTLNLSINRTEETISGSVQIFGVPQDEIVKLHAVDMEILSAGLLDTKPKFIYEDGILEIPLDNDFIGQAVTLEVKFQTKLNKNMEGCYLSTYHHQGREERIATTQFESHYARECFPCVDEPAAKAVFDLTLEVPDLTEGDVVLANTPLKSRQDQSFTFESTPRMSTYLLAWVIGKLHSVETTNKNGIKVTTYSGLHHPKSALTFANETAARALEYYDEKFGHKYPLPKLDQVALPDFEAGAMENWGLVTYRESMMVVDQDAAIDTKRSVSLTVTHELSHQWFGDLVTMDWWDDLWLNESFASIMEYYCTDSLYPEFKIWQDFFTGDCLAALRRDALKGVQAVKQEVHDPAEIATLFDGAIVYAKGARLILMLIRLMGESKFDQGVRDYFQKYQYQNTVGDNLWTALQPYAEFNVKEFMGTWIAQPGYPVISGVQVGAAASDQNQQRFLLSGETDDTKWPLPEVLDDMSGHYLINLDDKNFNDKLKHFNELSLEQRLRILIDRSLLAKTPAVPSASLLDLLPKFVNDNTAAVWDILGTITGDLKLFCPPDSAAEQNYKKYLAQLLAKRFEEIDLGCTSGVNETFLRDAFLGLALFVKDAKTLARLEELYQPDFSKIDPELRASVLGAKMLNDESEVFETLLDAYHNANDPELKATLLNTITIFAKQPEHLDQLVSLLDQPDIVRPQDHIYLFIFLLRNHRTRNQVLDWLYNNWDYIKKLTGDKSVEDYPRYAAALIRTPEDADKFFQFFDPLSNDPVLKRTVAIAHTEIAARLKLIASDAAEVVAKLEELTR